MATFLLFEPVEILRDAVVAGLTSMGHDGEAFASVAQMSDYQAEPEFALISKVIFRQRGAIRAVRRLLMQQPQPEIILLTNGWDLNPRTLRDLETLPSVDHHDTEAILNLVRLLRFSP